jgi:hypothetical protein
LSLSNVQLKDIACSGPLDMSRLTDDELRRIAAGEPPNAVVPSRRRCTVSRT